MTIPCIRHLIVEGIWLHVPFSMLISSAFTIVCTNFKPCMVLTNSSRGMLGAVSGGTFALDVISLFVVALLECTDHM